MSSDQAELESIETTDYLPVIIIAVVAYDYILTLSREIDYVWHRPWTRVSTLFVIIRYVGLCWAVTLALAGSSLVPGPVIACTAVFVIGDWGYILFLAAADLVMILRVYAMWKQSKKVLAILLFIYAPEIIFSIVWECIYNNTNGAVSVTESQFYNYKSCDYSLKTSPPQADRAIPRFVLGVALLILSLIPTLRHMVEMYKFTKRWQTNPLMKLLVREGAVYFVVNLYFNIVTAITLPASEFTAFLDALAYSLSCAIMPRFIISIRESYDRDLLTCRQQGIDTGFGVFSTQIANGNKGLSAMHFADVMTEQNQTLDYDVGDSRVIRLDALGDRVHQV